MNILLVEDNPSEVRLMKELMEGEGKELTIEWVRDGFEALEFMYKRNEFDAANTPDVVLLDLGLPRINGYNVLKELKLNATFAHIPVVILTTSRNPLDRDQCNALGADSYFPKPRTLKEFEMMVHQLLAKDLPHMMQRRRSA